jgi:uncharacterized protein YjdB
MVSSTGLVTALAKALPISRSLPLTAVFRLLRCDSQCILGHGVSLNKSEVSLVVNQTERLTATITPSDATNKNVTWSSDNTAAATVSSSGLVRGIGAGSANITVTTEDGDFQAICAVTVTESRVTGVSLNTSTDTVAVGYSDQLIATVAPADATNKNLTWSSDNPSVASVSSYGLVTGVSTGTANIVITTVDGSFQDNCLVTVVVATSHAITKSPVPDPIGQLLPISPRR